MNRSDPDLLLSRLFLLNRWGQLLRLLLLIRWDLIALLYRLSLLNQWDLYLLMNRLNRWDLDFRLIPLIPLILSDPDFLLLLLNR